VFLFQTIARRSAVTGVFRHQSDAEAFWASMPDEVRERNEGIEQEGLHHYPVFIIEYVAGDTNGLEYGTREDVEAAVQAGGDFTVYRVDGDWRGHPETPGTDYMGSLPHWHVAHDFYGHWRGTWKRPWDGS